MIPSTWSLITIHWSQLSIKDTFSMGTMYCNVFNNPNNRTTELRWTDHNASVALCTHKTIVTTAKCFVPLLVAMVSLVAMQIGCISKWWAWRHKDCSCSDDEWVIVNISFSYTIFDHNVLYNMCKKKQKSNKLEIFCV